MPSIMARSAFTRQGSCRGQLCSRAASRGNQATAGLATERPNAGQGKATDRTISIALDDGIASPQLEEDAGQDLRSGRSTTSVQPSSEVCGEPDLPGDRPSDPLDQPPRSLYGYRQRVRGSPSCDQHRQLQDQQHRTVQPWSGQSRQRSRAHKEHANGTAPTAASRPQAASLLRVGGPFGVEASLRGADKTLLIAMFRCHSWMDLRDLMNDHQEQYLEATRLTWAAAAAAETVTAAALSDAAGTPDDAWQEHPQQLGPRQGLRQPAAFTPRHLATGLHILSLRVRKPHALSHAERLQLGEFLGALGRGCVSLASRQAFPPVDLVMALRALAKLLGDTAADSPVWTISRTGISGGSGSSSMRDRWPAQSPVDGSGETRLDREDDVHGNEGLDDQYGDGASRALSLEGDSGGASSSVGAAAGGSGREVWRRGFPGTSAGSRWSAGRGRLHAAWLNAGWVDKMLAPTVEACLKDFEPRHVSGVLWALATLRVRPRPELLTALCERAVEYAPGTEISAGTGAPVMTAQGLSLTFWSLARLGFKPDTAVVESLMHGCEADMRAAACSGAHVALGTQAQPCSSLDLAQRAWAVATLGCHPRREWLELLVEAFLTRASVEQVSGQSCSMLIWALARLNGSSPAASPPPRTADATMGINAAATDLEELASDEQLHARLESSRQATTSGREEPAAMTAATARLPTRSTKPPVSVSSAPEVHSAARAPGGGGPADAAGGDVAGDFSEAARVRGFQRPDLVVALLAVIRGSLDCMSAQHLATVLWAMSALTVRPSEAWLEVFLDATSRRMTASLLESRPFGPQALSMILGAMAKLRYRPPPGWMHQYMEVCRKELPYFGAHSACVLGWSLVRLSYRPRGDWRRAFAARTQRLLPGMAPLGLCLLLWSLASWRFRPPSLWLNTAFAVSSEHLRDGAAAWDRGAAALEAQALDAGVADGTLRVKTAQPHPDRLQPELLAVLLWSMSHLLHRPPPPYWMYLADAASSSAMRYSRAAAASPVRGGSAAGAAVTAAAATAPAAATFAAMSPRTLAMLLQGWARLGRPPSQGVLSAALSYTAGEAAAAVAAAAAAPARPASAAGRIEPQHVVIVLWSCAVMGLEPPVDSVLQLIRLHSDLVLINSAPTAWRAAAHARRDDAEDDDNERGEGNGANAAPPAVLAAADAAQRNGADGPSGSLLQSAAGPPASSGDAAGQAAGMVQSEVRDGVTDGAGSACGSSRQQQLLQLQLSLARELVARQAELGMMVWALVKLGIDRPPKWLPAVLAEVGQQLELDAAACAAAAAATAGPDVNAALSLSATSSEDTPRGGGGTEVLGPLQSGEVTGSMGPTGRHATSCITLLTVKTLTRACLAWQVHPGDRWIAAATACLEAGALGTKVRRAYGRANLEDEVRYLLTQLQGEGHGSADEGGPGGTRAVAWVAAAEAASGAVLTNAVAAVAAGSAAAWMQGLVW